MHVIKANKLCPFTDKNKNRQQQQAVAVVNESAQEEEKKESEQKAETIQQPAPAAGLHAITRMGNPLLMQLQQPMIAANADSR